jgi:hypothetical protein
VIIFERSLAAKSAPDACVRHLLVKDVTSSPSACFIRIMILPLDTFYNLAPTQPPTISLKIPP